MKKNKFNETATLYLMNELSDEEKINFENFLFEDDEARKEFETMKTFHVNILNASPDGIEDYEIEQARASLKENIFNEVKNRTLFEKFSGVVRQLLFARYSIVYSSAFTLFAGVFIGYLVFSTTINTQDSDSQNNLQGISIDDIKDGKVDVSNIKFPNPFSKNGEMEIDFSAIKPISYSANKNDELMKILIAAALTQSKNPAVRIETANQLSNSDDNDFVQDQKIRDAVIKSVVKDENPVVRKEGLTLLAKYPYDEKIRDVLLHVISKDKNEGNRVLAMKMLSGLRIGGISIDNKMKEVLTNAKSDNNGFIKNNATKLLMGE